MTSILALRAAGLGDLLTALPALRALRRVGRVTLATPLWLAPLALWADGADEVLRTDDLEDSPPRLARDIAVNLHGHGPQSHRWLLASEPRRLIAFAHADVPESYGGPVWNGGEHEVIRWCNLVTSAGFAADPRDLLVSAPPDPLPPSDIPRVVIHAGAKDAARRWPVERWSKVARSLAGRGYDVVCTGSENELAIASGVALMAGLPRTAVIAGETDVLGLAGVLAGARLVLSGDTGVAHLAAALDRPSVTIYGPTSPSVWGPAPAPYREILWAGIGGDAHAPTPSAGLLRISVEQVMGAVDRVCGSTPVSAARLTR